MPGPQTCYLFGNFRLNAGSGLLFKDDRLVPLSVKAVETLRVLVENGGRTVRREELMAQVWPDAHVEEANLTVTISGLRKVLGDNKEAPLYIETIPKRGYRFIAPVTVEVDPVRAERWRRPIAIGVACAVLMAIAVAVLRPHAEPRVRRVVQLTHTGLVDTGPSFVTDGARLYFTQRRGAHWGLYQVSVDGGDPSPIATPFANVTLYDLSPDRSTLLIGSFEGRNASPVWLLRVAGGAPRRLGDITARDAVWTADGRSIVYTRETELFRVNAEDGSGAQRLAAMGGTLIRPRLDARGVVRFVSLDANGERTALWQVRLDGAGLRRLSPLGEYAGAPMEDESAGSWSGRDFFFNSTAKSTGGGVRTTLWARRQGSAAAVQLYSSASSLFGPVVSPDRRRLFVIGKQERYQLAEYDSATGQFRPYLSGISAARVAFSRDGQWITYIALPERSLWRSRADGSEAVQLTFPPMLAYAPRWSPDGRRIAYMGGNEGERAIYTISREGGAPEQITTGPSDNPYWSPDGAALLFQTAAAGTQLVSFDLASRRGVPMPGSEDLFWPAWSPDGRYLAAGRRPGQTLAVYDFRSRHWMETARRASICYVQWSQDSRSVYFQDCLGESGQPVFRVTVPDGRVERITPLEPAIPADVVTYGLTGVTPRGTLLATLIRNNSDLYSMELVWP